MPLGKRAMMPGKIVRSNEILAHLGDEYYAWQTASSAVATIERKKKSEHLLACFMFNVSVWRMLTSGLLFFCNTQHVTRY